MHTDELSRVDQCVFGGLLRETVEKCILTNYLGWINVCSADSYATPTPVPLFGELWERLLLSVMVLGFAALGLYMRR